jgi:hypothetical protein
MEHPDGDCDAPKQICMTFNATAESLVKRGITHEMSLEPSLVSGQRSRQTEKAQGAPG